MATQWIKLLLLMAVFLYAVASDNEVEEKRGGKTLGDVIKELAQVKQRLAKMESNRLLLLKGRDGRDGIPGTPGRPGSTGARGSKGPRGPQGLAGKHGARGPEGKKGGGAVYIRWGKTSCPVGAEFVYRGRIGGEYYNHYGGGSEYICLPEIPKYRGYKPGHQGGAYVYGAEYQVSGNNHFTRSYLHDHEAPCVACHVKRRSSKLMIPATYECPSRWTREYHGYLMGAHHGHKHSAGFICVDKDAEAVSGTHANLDGSLLYPVEGVCGALPCYPYVNGREFTCVVCTK